MFTSTVRSELLCAVLYISIIMLRNMKMVVLCMLEPRELTVPDTISARTLKDMDKAISNYKQGYVSDSVDLSDFE